MTLVAITTDSTFRCWAGEEALFPDNHCVWSTLQLLSHCPFTLIDICTAIDCVFACLCALFCLLKNRPSVCLLERINNVIEKCPFLTVTINDHCRSHSTTLLPFCDYFFFSDHRFFSLSSVWTEGRDNFRQGPYQAFIDIVFVVTVNQLLIIIIFFSASAAFLMRVKKHLLVQMSKWRHLSLAVVSAANANALSILLEYWYAPADIYLS